MNPPRRFGSSLVNFYAVEDGGRWTLLDAGLPRFWPQLEASGIRTEAIEAVVLTHAHVDHAGVANRLAERGVRVYIHEAESEAARAGLPIKETEKSQRSYLRHPAAWRMRWHFACNGGTRPLPIREVTTFVDGEQLDVPGRPRIVHTPGHTDGHCVLQLEDGTLILGDLLCSLNPLTGERGPQLIPRGLSKSSAHMLSSLDKIATLDGGTLLFGHGEAWHEGVASAVARARVTGPT